MLKRILPLLFLALILSGCTHKKTAPTANNAKVRQLINELETSKRPFVGIFPHSSGRLLTLLIDNVQQGFKSASIDMEYLSGNALKGGRASIDLSKGFPRAQGFLLGSCSTGGKCSFDTNLINGTLKTRLEVESTTLHVLKSDYLFVNGTVTSADGRISYKPTKPKQQNQIISDTQGLPKAIDGTLAYGPLLISAVTSDKVSGELSIKANDTKGVQIYDGSTYQDLKATINPTEVKINLNHNPWSKTVTIVRDDEKGAEESVTLYAVGPIILLK